MQDVKFDNGSTYGSMLVDKVWYESQPNKDGWKLYEAAKNDPKSRMMMICIFDRGFKTSDTVTTKKTESC